MKKKKLHLSLNKQVVSNLQMGAITGAGDVGTSSPIVPGNCISCICRSNAIPCGPQKPDPDHTRGCPSWNIPC